MRLGPTAESLDFGSACLSFQSKKGRLYSSEISNVKLTFFLHLNGLKLWAVEN